jgi:hypothetical protein
MVRPTQVSVGVGSLETKGPGSVIKRAPALVRVFVGMVGGAVLGTIAVGVLTFGFSLVAGSTAMRSSPGQPACGLGALAEPVFAAMGGAVLGGGVLLGWTDSKSEDTATLVRWTKLGSAV